jgi:hypothetical protein
LICSWKWTPEACIRTSNNFGANSTQPITSFRRACAGYNSSRGFLPARRSMTNWWMSFGSQASFWCWPCSRFALVDFGDGGRYSSLFVAHTATSQGSRSRALFICVNHLISLVVQFKHVETTIDDDGTNPNVDFVFSNAPPGHHIEKVTFSPRSAL